MAHGIHGIHGKAVAGSYFESVEKENDYENEERFFWGRDGRAAGAEMAGREPLSRGAGDGGK